MFVAQQAISRDIRRLEDQLGTRLFARNTRRVTLTPDGERLLVRARDLIAINDGIIDELGASTRPIVVDLLSEGRLTGPTILEATRAAAPDREFRGRYGHGVGAALRLLQTGELDIALGRAQWRNHRLPAAIATTLVRWEPLGVLLPATHPLASMAAVPVGALAGSEIDSAVRRGRSRPPPGRGTPTKTASATAKIASATGGREPTATPGGPSSDADDAERSRRRARRPRAPASAAVNPTRRYEVRGPVAPNPRDSRLIASCCTRSTVPANTGTNDGIRAEAPSRACRAPAGRRGRSRPRAGAPARAAGSARSSG